MIVYSQICHISLSFNINKGLTVTSCTKKNYNLLLEEVMIVMLLSTRRVVIINGPLDYDAYKNTKQHRDIHANDNRAGIINRERGRNSDNG